LCVMWCLWRERNARNFEDCEHEIIELKKRVLRTLFYGEFCGILLKFQRLRNF
jgi:hypothetical protein